jgi:hypothetical protein
MPIPSGIMFWCTRTQDAARRIETERSGEGLGHRGGAERRAGALLARGLRPMIVAGEPSTGSFRDRDIGSARPTGGSHGLTTHDPAQRFKDAMPLAALAGPSLQRGQGHYRGRGPKARSEVLEELH